MAWYKTGTVTVTNGSATVTGAGTAFVGAVLAGHGFAAPDGKLYEIDAVVSATQITLASPYLGATAAGATYGIFPTNGALTPFATRLDTALSGMQSVIDGAGQGKFAAGTPAAPGLRFTADGDTGFTNPAANQIGMVTGGVLRALLSGTAFNLSVPLTGTAVTQSASDVTAGRLLKVGDFGLGQMGTVPHIVDLDAVDKAVGTYYYGSATTNIASKPAGSAGQGIVEISRPYGTFCVQTLTEASGKATGNFVWHRSYSTPLAAWSAWALHYDQSCILGTVAQASGVPTGALIERGSNANGEYVRFADGTQICSAAILSDAGAAKSWTFPAAFSAAPNVTGSAIATVLSALCLDAAPTTTAATFSARDKTDARRADTCHLIARGRWF
jgi:hypothetical protein